MVTNIEHEEEILLDNEFDIDEAENLSDKRKIFTEQGDLEIESLLGKFKRGRLNIQPEYQRAYRWSEEQKTKFIESILLGIPIPPIFVAEDSEGKWELVDGLQRISTILSFFGILKKNEDDLEVLDIQDVDDVDDVKRT